MTSVSLNPSTTRGIRGRLRLLEKCEEFLDENGSLNSSLQKQVTEGFGSEFWKTLTDVNYGEAKFIRNDFSIERTVSWVRQVLDHSIGD
jgi:hypothetical protein